MSVSAEQIKQEIFLELDKLPEHQLAEVLGFINLLLSRTNPSLANRTASETRPEPGKNPLLKFAGAVSHGNLAQDIDNELYNSNGYLFPRAINLLHRPFFHSGDGRVGYLKNFNR